MPGILSGSRGHDGFAHGSQGKRQRAISLALRWAPVPMLLSVGRMANVSLSSAMKNTGRQTVLTPMASSLRSFPNSTTGVRSVTAGQNDLIYQLPPRQKAVVERSNNLKLVNGPTLYVFQVFLNWAKPPFDDIRVRKAFNFAIDREAFVKASLAGLAEPAYMNLPKSHWAYDKSVAGLYPYDPDKARTAACRSRLQGGTESKSAAIRIRTRFSGKKS